MFHSDSSVIIAGWTALICTLPFAIDGCYALGDKLRSIRSPKN